MIDRIIYKLFGYLDLFAEQLDKIMFPKTVKKIKKKSKCKDCHCKCHCKEILHSHFYDGELCTCETCKC
mgnify:CR=1 FL=1